MPAIVTSLLDISSRVTVDSVGGCGVNWRP